VLGIGNAKNTMILFLLSTVVKLCFIVRTC